MVPKVHFLPQRYDLLCSSCLSAHHIAAQSVEMDFDWLCKTQSERTQYVIGFKRDWFAHAFSESQWVRRARNLRIRSNNTNQTAATGWRLRCVARSTIWSYPKWALKTQQQKYRSNHRERPGRIFCDSTLLLCFDDSLGIVHHVRTAHPLLLRGCVSCRLCGRKRHIRYFRVDLRNGHGARLNI